MQGDSKHVISEVARIALHAEELLDIAKGQLRYPNRALRYEIA